MKIIIDDREHDPVLIHLKNYPQVEVSIARLPIGDYQFEEKMIFERKTLVDFANSIIDGRLFDQMCRMVRSRIRGILILEGTQKDLVNVGVSRESMQGALVMISVVLGIPILRSMNPEESARLMIYAANQISSITNLATSRHGRRPKGKLKTQLHILQGLPGVGPWRAKLLLERFGSIECVINASFAELQSVVGIGKKTAEQIKWAVKEQSKQYGVVKKFMSEEI